jgi:hypothetical protein
MNLMKIIDSSLPTVTHNVSHTLRLFFTFFTIKRTQRMALYTNA